MMSLFRGSSNVTPKAIRLGNNHLVETLSLPTHYYYAGVLNLTGVSCHSWSTPAWSTAIHLRCQTYVRWNNGDLGLLTTSAWLTDLSGPQALASSEVFRLWRPRRRRWPCRLDLQWPPGLQHPRAWAQRLNNAHGNPLKTGCRISFVVLAATK